MIKMETGRCRGCGAPIVWIRTQAGKFLKDKKVVTEDGRVLSVQINPPKSAELLTPTGTGYISHFATCPKAGGFRKGKVKK